MTAKQLGVIAFSCLGIWLFGNSFTYIAWAFQERMWMHGQLAAFAVECTGGVMVLVWRERIASRLFPAGAPIDRAALVDVQAAAVSLLGIWFLAAGLATLAAGLSSNMETWGEAQRSMGAVQIGSGTALLGFRARITARLCRPVLPAGSVATTPDPVRGEDEAS